MARSLPIAIGPAPEKAKVRNPPHPLQPNALSLDLGMIKWLADCLTFKARADLRDDAIMRVRTAHYQHASKHAAAAEMSRDLEEIAGQDAKSNDLRRVLLLNKFKTLSGRQIESIFAGFRGH